MFFTTASWCSRVDGAVVATFGPLRPPKVPMARPSPALADLVLGPFTLDAGAKVEVELLVSDANPADNVVWRLELLQLQDYHLTPEKILFSWNPLRVQAIAPVPDLIRFGLESLDPASFDVVDSPEAFQPGYDFTVWRR